MPVVLGSRFARREPMVHAVYSLIATSGLLFGAMPPRLPGSGDAAPLPADAPFGYLWFYCEGEKGQTLKKVEPYCPRAGDLVFFDDQSKFWTFLYAIASTAPPFHVGIVVK